MSKEELELNWNLRKIFAIYADVETMEVMTETLARQIQSRSSRACSVLFTEQQYPFSNKNSLRRDKIGTIYP
jgi:hypothetical protein